MTLLEICLDDVDGAPIAEVAGADRLELCASLGEGGITPSLGTVAAVFDRVQHVGVQVLVRQRPGDFVYSDGELDSMAADIGAIRALPRPEGVRLGFVVGALSPDGSVNRPATERLVAAARDVPVTFHKAFDQCPDQFAALDQLVALGFERVLTSGGAATAIEGSAELARLVSHASGRIAVLAGGGVAPRCRRTHSEDRRGRSAPACRRFGAQRSAHRHDRRITHRTKLRSRPPHRDFGSPRRPHARRPRHHEGDRMTAARTRRAVLAVDLGGTAMKGAVVDEDGRTLDGARSLHPRTTSRPRSSSSSRAPGTRIDLGCSPGRRCGRDAGVGRRVARRRGYASNLGWQNMPLLDVLASALSLPVAVGHDVRAAGLAEQRFGAARGRDDFVLVPIGSVAAALVTGGGTVIGATGAAGESATSP